MISNTNIEEIKEILSPDLLLEQYKLKDDDVEFIEESRKTIENILLNKDKRLLVIVGPCSIHNYDSALEYARMLKSMNFENLFIVMRVYFEKPRSRTGWKGFIYDPNLDNSFKINEGLTLARKLLLEITKLRIPIGCEFLDTITPQYLSDLVSWGAIGARTSESQIHRQLASGLSMPIGFKNLTSGDYEKAIDGIISGNYSHNFLGVDTLGKVSHIITKGNIFCHLILRGGLEPNYYQCCIEDVSKTLEKEKLSTGILIDCSHGNSQKECSRQILVALYVKRLRLLNKYPIRGIMLESNIHKGSQKISNNLEYGVSITDACIDFSTTKILLELLNKNDIVNISNLTEIRQLIREFDIAINENNNTLNKNVLTNYIFEADKEITKLPSNDIQIMNISMRLALSEKVAELKFKSNPFKYLLKSNDFLSLITDREIEKDNLNKFSNCIYLKIMEISKNLQVDFLEAYTNDVKIGYLFGKGSFSHEAVQNFRGNHIVYESIGELYMALLNGRIDYILVPTYNSIIGEIILLDLMVSLDKKGSIEHKIELNLYCNIDSKNIDILFLEPHIQKEAEQYIKTLTYNDIRNVKSTAEGCKKILENEVECATIASSKNECNLYYTIAKDVVKHNITTFSLF